MIQKGIWEVAWPLLVSFALSFSLHFVDSFFLSRVSDEAAGAVGSLFPVIGTAIVVFSAVGQAGSSVASQLIGARRLADVPIAYLALVAFNLSVGLLVSFGAVAFHRELPPVLGLSGAAAAHAESYLVAFGGFQFLKAVQVAYAGIITSRGETRWVLAEALITNVCNVALNLMFMHGTFGMPRLGVVGVALATTCSLAVGLAFTMCVVYFHFGVRIPWSTPLREVWTRLRSILRIGLPSALEPISYQLMQIVVNGLVISWGTAALAARVYVWNLIMVSTILWSLSLGIATQILVAHHIGAERFVDAEKQVDRSLVLAIGGNFLLVGLLAIFHETILSLLTTDPKVHEFARPLFFVGLLVEPARAVNIIVGGSLRSSGDARYTSVVGLSVMWSFAMPACYVLGKVFGLRLTGIWIAFALDEFIRGVINHRRWRAGHWQRAGVVSQRQSVPALEKTAP